MLWLRAIIIVLGCLSAVQAQNMTIGILNADPAFIPGAELNLSIHIPYKWIRVDNQLSEAVAVIWGITNTTIASNVLPGTFTEWIRVHSDYPPTQSLPVNITYMNGSFVSAWTFLSSEYDYLNISLTSQESAMYMYAQGQLSLQSAVAAFDGFCFSDFRGSIICQLDYLSNASRIPPVDMLYTMTLNLTSDYNGGSYLGTATSQATYSMPSFWIYATSNETEVGSNSVITVEGSFYTDKTYACHFVVFQEDEETATPWANSSFSYADPITGSLSCEVPEIPQSLLKSYSQIKIDYLLLNVNGTLSMVYCSAWPWPFKLTPPIDTNEDEWEWVLGAVLGAVGIAVIVVILVLVVIRRRRLQQSAEYKPMLST